MAASETLLTTKPPDRRPRPAQKKRPEPRPPADPRAVALDVLTGVLRAATASTRPWTGIPDLAHNGGTRPRVRSQPDGHRAAPQGPDRNALLGSFRNGRCPPRTAAVTAILRLAPP